MESSSTLAISNKVFGVFLFVFLVFNCFRVFMSEAQVLPDEEVQTLGKIAEKLKNSYWQVSPTFCSGGEALNETKDSKALSKVTCNCSFNSNTTCHVTRIMLQRLNLAGVLGEEFADLPHLREIDLNRIYLSGKIPTRWAQSSLINIDLSGNRISGSIPKEVGYISTLKELILENNQLNGNLPPELGYLTGLQRFLVSANNLTGTIPETFVHLKNLIDFRIDGNGIFGPIPDFIGNWTKLDRLDMQGTSLEGPLPVTISLLLNLTQLRVSDLSGSNINFPKLQNLTNMKELVLRNCLITGPIPEYIGKVMNSLNTLDLSFNILTGPIPSKFENLHFLFLNNNLLTGKIPRWIMENRDMVIDISFNNFTGTSQSDCQKQTKVKTIASYSSSEDKSVPWCLKKDLPCSKKSKYHSLFINCGGETLKFGGEEYEGDSSTMGESDFYSVENRYACSTTGIFLDSKNPVYVATERSATNKTNPSIYKTARLAPVSLKYYGLCLLKGSYTVELYFAEIVFTDDKTYSSLGKRVFDVSIQGEIRLMDFNIAKEAGGVGKGLTRNFTDVIVNGSTLEIHLYWLGKGTNAIPEKGVYGPLISAIRVTPNFDPDTGLSVGAIMGIVVASCVVIVFILVVLRMKGFLGGKDLENRELKRSIELQTGYFSLRQIKDATGNFDPTNKIGEGGFGPVYKGIMPDGLVIAVKQLSSKSKQGNREFLNEIAMISALQHPNLVKLFGCCIEGNQLLLIYEYLENNSLALALFGSEENRLNLDWPTRLKICLGIARGLAYLHEESRLKVVHRDIKATNILLDKDLNAKISDFGLAKLDEEENTHISTRVAGTM